MNKKAYNFVEVRMGAMDQAAATYGVDKNAAIKAASGIYNVGMDEVLRTVALTVLEGEDDFLSGYTSSLEEYGKYLIAYQRLEAELKSNEQLNGMLLELDSQAISYSTEIEKEHFIQGFICGYKMLKNANFL